MTILNFLWQDTFLNWVKTLFVMPFLNLEMLWILVPVWLSWFFSEFYQEKVGTSMGNAISNATIIIWAAIDCARQTVKLISLGEVTGGLNIFFRFFLIAVIFMYGSLILVLGLKGKTIIKKIGRIREMSYVFCIFVPVFYNYAQLTVTHIISALVFFPIFYFALELLDHIVPDPVAIKLDIEDTQGISSIDKKLGPTNPEQPKPEQSSQQPSQQPFAPQPHNPNYPQSSQQPQKLSPLLANRRKGGGFWDFKL